MSSYEKRLYDMSDLFQLVLEEAIIQMGDKFYSFLDSLNLTIHVVTTNSSENREKIASNTVKFLGMSGYTIGKIREAMYEAQCGELIDFIDFYANHSTNQTASENNLLSGHIRRIMEDSKLVISFETLVLYKNFITHLERDEKK